jgi:hypothetical protein
MIVSAGWGVKAVLTDKVAHFVSVRQEVSEEVAHVADAA